MDLLKSHRLPSLVCCIKRLSGNLLALAVAAAIVGCQNQVSEDVGIEIKNQAGVAGANLASMERSARYAGGSGVVMRGGKIIYTWGDTNKRYDLKSTTKSIGVLALGLAMGDGLIKLKDPVINHYPEFDQTQNTINSESWSSEVTVLQLTTHTAGFGKPGGYPGFIYAPGSAWAYSDAGPNWLADTLTHIYKKDLYELMAQKIFEPIGISDKDLRWRENAYRPKLLGKVKRREFGSGIKANVIAMARIGNLLLEKGNWEGKQILPEDFVQSINRPVSINANLQVINDPKMQFENAPSHYGLLWWNNHDIDMPRVPRDAFWSWGLYDSIIAVIPSLDLVFARAGGTINGQRQPNFYRVFEPLFEGIVESINHGSPRPNSSFIANIRWADRGTIIRRAIGSDNWPLTWADDNDLYTAYGDGHGFDPKVDTKLSMGYAKVIGLPPDFRGINIRSRNEQLGQGKTGKKASGLLGMNGLLYMWVRNANNNHEGSQLAWSGDHGVTWKWCDWSFSQFGFCTFINYGRDYSGAKDDFVYSVSHDHPSAYERANRFVLMRVPKSKISEQSAYEFFNELSKGGKPIWTHDISQRGAIFEDPGRCYRSGISYNKFLKRYFWWQAKFRKGVDGRHESKHFGIFEAPEPWGPWNTVYFTSNWDVTTGEMGNFPTKWISENGKVMYLVFSGNDAFSVRKANVILAPVNDEGY